MERLIDTVRGLFAAATASGGELARTTNFTLESVDWTSKQNRPEPVTNPLVDIFLSAACANSGPSASSSRILAAALLTVAGQLKWRTPPRGREDGPVIAAFSRNFTSTCIIGEGGVLPSNKVTAGFSLQGPGTYYPPHAHRAEESYWIIGGGGGWKVGTDPWFAVKPGESIYHESRALHAMRTNERPLLSVWLWTSYLSSEVMFLRG